MESDTEKIQRLERQYCELSALFHAVIEAAEGRPVSDFMESFGGVRLVVDLRAELEAASTALAEKREVVGAIAALVNGYHNDATTLTAAETLLAVAQALGDPW